VSGRTTDTVEAVDRSLTTTGQTVFGPLPRRVLNGAVRQFDLGKPRAEARWAYGGTGVAAGSATPLTPTVGGAAESYRDLLLVPVERRWLRPGARVRAVRTARAVVVNHLRVADILQDTLDAPTASVAMVNCTASNTTSSDTVTDTSAARVV
jgi:hypothetical protein